MRIGKTDAFIESFAAFKVAITKRMEAELSRTNTVVELGAMGTAKAEAFDGVVLDAAGNAIFIPYSYGAVVHLDISSNVYTETAVTSAASARFSGGCLANNGLIVMAPLLHGFVGLYNASTKTYTDGPAKLSGKGYRGAVCVSDTLVVLIPSNAATPNIALYNPITNKLIEGPATPAAGVGGYEGGCLLPDGRVFLCPVSTGNPAIYDPKANTCTIITAPVSFGNNEYSNAVCLPNGWVVLCPRSAEPVYVWDSLAKKWLSKTIITPNGNTKWRGGVLAQNGDIILIPYSYTNIGRLRLDNFTYEESSTKPVSGSTYQFGASLPDGRILMAPYNGSAINPKPLMYTPCTQGAGFGSFVTQSKFMNHK